MVETTVVVGNSVDDGLEVVNNSVEEVLLVVGTCVVDVLRVVANSVVDVLAVVTNSVVDVLIVAALDGVHSLHSSLASPVEQSAQLTKVVWFCVHPSQKLDCL